MQTNMSSNITAGERFDLVADNANATSKLLANLCDELRFAAKSARCVDDMVEEDLPEEADFAKDTLMEWVTKPVVKSGPDSRLTVEDALKKAISDLTFELDRLQQAKAKIGA